MINDAGAIIVAFMILFGVVGFLAILVAVVYRLIIDLLYGDLD